MPNDPTHREDDSVVSNWRLVPHCDSQSCPLATIMDMDAKAPVATSIKRVYAERIMAAIEAARREQTAARPAFGPTFDPRYVHRQTTPPTPEPVEVEIPPEWRACQNYEESAYDPRRCEHCGLDEGRHVADALLPPTPEPAEPDDVCPVPGGCLLPRGHVGGHEYMLTDTLYDVTPEPAPRRMMGATCIRPGCYHGEPHEEDPLGGCADTSHGCQPLPEPVDGV